jgi:hypothetical protein
MTPNRLWYQSGQFDRCIDDVNTDFGKRIFAVLYQYDPVYIVTKLAHMKKQPGVPRHWEERLKIMLTVAYLVNNNVKQAAETFNTIDGKVILSKIDQWDALYQSTYRFLYMVLTSDDLLRERPASAPKVAVIGDSHTIGISGIAGAGLMRYYVPALVIRGLSNPSVNNFKQAVLNAVTMAYQAERVVFSIGEIDSRGFCSKLAGDGAYWEKMGSRWLSAVDASYEYIASLRNPMQEFGVFVPPPPSQNVVSGVVAKSERGAVLTELCVSATDEFRRQCRELAAKHGLAAYDYPSSMITEEGLTSSDSLLDHAHFKLHVYKELIDQIM